MVTVTSAASLMWTDEGLFQRKTDENAEFPQTNFNVQDPPVIQLLMRGS